MYKINNIDDAKALEGKELGISDWVVVDQDKIEKFAIATGDDQWIHLDQDNFVSGASPNKKFHRSKRSQTDDQFWLQ